MALKRIGVAVLPEVRPAGARGIATAAEAEDFWTPERMAEAQPIFLPVLPVPDEPEPERARGFGAAGEGLRGPTRSDPVPPDRAEVETLAFGSFQTTRVGDKISAFPYSAIGKLFMVFPNAPGVKTFQGSAWVIGEKAIFTAGHCLFDHTLGGAANAVVFAGEYRQQQWLKKWTVVNKAVPNAWKGARDFRADMGVCILSEPIRPTLGKLGYRSFVPPPPSGPYTQIGYPAHSLSPEFPFDGQEMWQCVGAYASTPQPINNNMGVIQANSNLTEGCSGGPWVDEQDQFRAVGLNSHRLGNDTNHMNAPYFGDRFAELLDWMTQNGGDS
jgi:Trypsin